MSSKTEVTEGAQLKNNDYYVAVGSEKFKDVEYGSQTAVLSTKHLQKRRYPSLAPIKKGSGSESSADAFSDRRQSLVEDSPMTVEKEETVARPKKKAAALEPAKEEGIPVKPIKHIKRADTEKPANDMVMEEPRRQVVEDHADKRAEEPQAIHAEQQNQNKSEQGTSGKRVAGNSKLSKADKPSDDAKSKSSKDDKPKEVPSAQPAAPKKVQDDKPPAPLASKKAPVEPASQPSVPKKVQADSAPQTSVAKKMTDSKAKHGEKKASTKKPEPVSKQEKEIDFDQEEPSPRRDDGGIFKSKSKKQIAKEIPEADNVETDVPIDKRPAQEIEEVEEDHRNDNDEEDFDELLNGAATKIQAAYKGYRVRLEIG